MQETATIMASSTTTDLIDHSMLVSDINRQYPQCRPVFEKHGIAGCGGEYGPPEPLFIFTAAHRVPLRELVEELNRARRGEWKNESAVRKAEGLAEAESEILYKRFVFGALFVALTAGFGLGLVNLTRIALAQSYYEISGVLKQIHGHAQVFGWVGLSIMGVAFHAVPRMKMQPLRPLRAAKWCFWLLLGGVLQRVVSQPLARNPFAAAVLLISGVLELTAIGLFVWLLGGSVVRSQQEREPYEKFIGTSIAWFAILGLWNFWIVWLMFWKRSVGIPALQDALWIHAAFFGFIANMIFGFSLRVLPHFLGLRESKTWAANVVFVLWNAAIFLRYPLERLAWAASVLEAVAIILFVWALGGVRPASHEDRDQGCGQHLCMVCVPRLRVVSHRGRDAVPCRRVPPQRLVAAHHGNRFHHQPDHGCELSRVADFQRRESMEHSAHARVILASGRGQHAGARDGF